MAQEATRGRHFILSTGPVQHPRVRACPRAGMLGRLAGRLRAGAGCSGAAVATGTCHPPQHPPGLRGLSSHCLGVPEVRQQQPAAVYLKTSHILGLAHPRDSILCWVRAVRSRNSVPLLDSAFPNTINYGGCQSLKPRGSLESRASGASSPSSLAPS